MLVTQLRTRVDETHIRSRAGTPVTENDLALLLTRDVRVLKPNGDPLLVLRRGAIPPAHLDAAYPGLHALRKHSSSNRSNYTGGERGYRIREDGTLSRTMETANAPATAIAGYFDRYPRIPFCRQSAFTAKEVGLWAAMGPMIRTVADEYRTHVPARYEAQMSVARATHPDFVIAGTPFTTLTVNNNAVANIHKDSGDLPDGFGCISVLRRGQYRGFALVFPGYRVGAELDTGDVLFFDPHEWHANLPPRDADPDYERISVVYYFRKNMRDCGSAAEEGARARDKYGRLDPEAAVAAAEADLTDATEGA